ncbi:hypothetical protein HYPSUDRAFT_340249 [Hypholoma sublateritium FD-334 SS-4]|uniref:RBR-type E3 ubiquitin transferase n=1 Tax=Hypholoma sublateritium (strain FD-334 SS-4) TaxID=945553 RepID=A0A0D2P4U6_HYPSF|nr:hypothetical protein HYPSUDRAFT_340249 [Hypholoma sublateritium FD-334 SS-4]
MLSVIHSSSPAASSSTHALKDLELCQTLQREELDVLESIYPEYISSAQPNGHLKFEIPVELEQPCLIEFVRSGPPAEGQKVSLSVLPPLLLRITLPATYPLYEAPHIASIRTVHEWAPDISKLQRVLAEMWTSEETVLYRWIDYILSEEFLQELGFDMTNNRPLQVQHPDPSTMVSQLESYQQSFLSTQFCKVTYPCGICLEHLKGSKCLQLACEHIFCRPCLLDFWGMCIGEGDVDRVGCPDPECVKEGRKSSEEDVSRVVSEQELERWKWLKTKKQLELDPTILNCPIARCQALIPKPKGVDAESGWDRFRQCPDCSFSFCSFCKYTWHGPITQCPLPFTERLFQQYSAAAKGSRDRALIESRYGKETLVRLVKEHEDQQATESWITESTSVCPGCQSHVQKSDGCNHMTCARCGQHFCYRCQGKLKEKDPYEHYRIRGTYCYEMLFAPDEDYS